jgi:hypothetical protein
MKRKSEEVGRTVCMVATISFALLLMATFSPSAAAQTNTFPSSGNTGVGTTSPTDPVQVSSASGVNIRMTDSASSTSSYLSHVSNWSIWQSNRNPITGTKPDSGRTVAGIYFQALSGDSSIHFQTSTTNGADPTERMVIDKSGNVGIGAGSPTTKLEIVAGSVADGIRLTGNTSGTLSPAFKFFDSSTQRGVFGLAEGSGHFSSDASVGDLVLRADTGRLLFQTGTGASSLAISSGNVGIGTPSPSYLLDVAGVIRSTGGFRFNDNTVQTTAATMTGVTAGAGLTGGGTSGSVTLTNDDRGSSQNIFKNVANAGGTTQFSAGSNSDGIRFAGSNGTSVTFDAATKKVIIDGSTSTPSAGNISAGQFGQNTGGGNYTFPGNVTVNGNINAKYQDLAEWVPSSEQLPAGTVVVLDSTKSNQVIASSVSYDTRVAGVISEQPGIALGEGGANKVLVATTGRVRVKVDATHAPIQVGDLLVASDVPGMAMKSEPVNIGDIQLHRPGTLIGKALEPLTKGQGTILVLLSLQ